MSKLYCSETVIVVEKKNPDYGRMRITSGFTTPYETFAETTGELYRACMKSFGRCTGKMYIDDSNNHPMQVGWIFLKNNPDDKEDETLIETWVEVYTTPPVRRTIFKGGEHPKFGR